MQETEKKQRVVVVTGGSSGIGRAIATAFAHQGDQVIITARHAEELRAATEAIFGYTREELEGKRVEAFIPTRLRGRHVQHRSDYNHNPRMRPMGIGLSLILGKRKRICVICMNAYHKKWFWQFYKYSENRIGWLKYLLLESYSQFCFKSI